MTFLSLDVYFVRWPLCHVDVFFCTTIKPTSSTTININILLSCHTHWHAILYLVLLTFKLQVCGGCLYVDFGANRADITSDVTTRYSENPVCYCGLEPSNCHLRKRPITIEVIACCYRRIPRYVQKIFHWPTCVLLVKRDVGPIYNIN